MKKTPPSRAKAAGRPARYQAPAKRGAKIAAGLERLDALEPQSAEAAGLIGLLRSWLDDESGYDEQTWPELKKALDQERRQVGARRLFGD